MAHMMKRSLLACTALIAVGSVVAPVPRAAAATMEELQAQNQQLLDEVARLKTIIKRDHAAQAGSSGDQARRGAADALRSPSPVSSPAAPRSPQARGPYAADMPLKAAPAPVPLYDWSGPYAGVNLGWSVGASRGSQSSRFPVTNSVSADVNGISPNGIVDGAQIGWNWQGGRNWLVGVEADLQSSDEKDTACTISCISAVTSTGRTIASSFAFAQRLDWFGTARARLGFVQDGALFYVTGGGAFGRVHLSGSVDAGGGAVGADQGFTQFGWAAGGGVEAALGGRWTGKLEYLYLDLGDMSVAATGTAGNPFTQTTTASFHDHIFRGGINYRFGAEPAYASAGPVPMLYAGPAYQWTGFYVGGNVGLGIGTTRTSLTDTQAAFFPNPSVTGFTPQDSVLNPFGAVGGAQAGFNWQGGRHWLVGVEGDVQGSSLNGRACAPFGCFVQSFNSGGGLFDDDANAISQRLDFFATARARAGYVNGNLLFYATGGLAFGRVDETISHVVTGPGVIGGAASVSTTTNQVGWTAGAGIEAALSERLTGKIEYLHLDLGSVSNSYVLPQDPFPPLNFNNTSTVRADVVRAGMNYRIGP